MLVHDASKLDFLVKLVGPHQVALGSDYPFPLGEAVPGTLIESMPYDTEIKAMLRHGTALNWLDLKKEPFAF